RPAQSAGEVLTMRNNRALCALLSGLCLLQAQQQPPATPAAGVPKFTSNTQLVVEIVSVRDKDGKPVEGLTAKDFIITENGVPQTISFSEYQKLDDTPGLPILAPRPETAVKNAQEKPKADPIAAPAIQGSA